MDIGGKIGARRNWRGGAPPRKGADSGESLSQQRRQDWLTDPPNNITTIAHQQ
jgi:hypothetical protein